MIKYIAAFVTLIACAMASVAAWERGGDVIDRVLLISISIVIVLAVHLLPGLTRRRATWIVWFACLLAAIYGHLTFLTYASQRAASHRADQSAVAVGTQQQIQVLQNALDAIKARPVSVVAADMYRAKKWRDVLRYREELKEAKHAEQLKITIAGLYGKLTTKRTDLEVDPVIAKVSEVTGISANDLSVGIGLIFSILVEVVGALLWAEALHGKREERTFSNVKIEAVTTESQPVTTQITPIVTDDVTQVKDAIIRGVCRATVASIREYLKCSQQRAMEVRREVTAVMPAHVDMQIA